MGYPYPQILHPHKLVTEILIVLKVYWSQLTTNDINISRNQLNFAYLWILPPPSPHQLRGLGCQQDTQQIFLKILDNKLSLSNGEKIYTLAIKFDYFANFSMQSFSFEGDQYRL